MIPIRKTTALPIPSTPFLPGGCAAWQWLYASGWAGIRQVPPDCVGKCESNTCCFGDGEKGRLGPAGQRVKPW